MHNTESKVPTYYSNTEITNSHTETAVESGRLVFGRQVSVEPNPEIEPKTLPQKTNISYISIDKYILHFDKVELANNAFKFILDDDTIVDLITTKEQIQKSTMLNIKIPAEYENTLIKALKDSRINFSSYLQSMGLTLGLTTITGALINNVMGKKIIPYNIICDAMCVTAISYTLFGIYNLLVSPEPYFFKIENLLRINHQSVRDSIIQNIPDIVVTPSVLHHIDFSKIFKAIYQNLKLQKSQILQLTKAFYLGVATTWMQLQYEYGLYNRLEQLDDEKKQFFDEMIPLVIINNTLSLLSSEQQFINDSSVAIADNIDAATNSKISAITAKAILKLKYKDKLTAAHGFKPVPTVEEYVEKLTSLPNGFYFITSSSEGKDGAICLVNNDAHLHKYIYYQPLTEIECSTESPEKFIRMLKNKSCLEFEFNLLDDLKNNQHIEAQESKDLSNEID